MTDNKTRYTLRIEPELLEKGRLRRKRPFC